MVGKTVNKSVDRALFEITPEIQHFAGLCEKNNAIDKELYTKYEVKRGLRDLNGKGVLAGLTNISDVCAKKIVNGEEVPCAGNLYYRGYNIKDLVGGFLKEDHFGSKRLLILLYLVNFRIVLNLRCFMKLWWREERFRRTLCVTLS